MLYLKFFDAFSATFKSTQIVNFRSQKIKALLAYLAVEAGRVHQRDTLVDLLWSKQSTANGKKNFSQSLSRLQRAIANQQAVPPYLIITRHTVQWNLDSGYWLDVNTFLQATENALSQIDRPQVNQPQVELTTAYEQLDMACKFYQGDFLAGFFVANAPEFDNWVAATREQFYQQMLTALAHVTQRAEEVGHYEQAIKFAQRQIELNSWNEPAHRSLMRGLAITGRRSEAIAQFDHCVEILEAELDVDPSQETTILHQQIIDGLYSPSVTIHTRPSAEPVEADRPLRQAQGAERLPPILDHDSESIVSQTKQDNVALNAQQSYLPPIRTTHFIGRATELHEIVTRLDEPEIRLITLTGPGGVGKTSLAQEIARTVCDKHANGAAFVPMAAIDRELEIAPAILQALKRPVPNEADAVDNLLAYLEPLDMLLVLDNYEQLISTQTANLQSGLAHNLLITILERAPRVKLLITSRVRLNLAPEWVHAIDGMTLPPTVDPASQESVALKLDEVEQSNAVAFFVRNAQQARSSFTLSEQNMHAVAQICHTLGGLPLGLELAAGWVRVLSCQEIYAEIQENLEILAATSPDVPARHRSVQAVFDSSWQRLSSGAQEVVHRLSIFRGQYDRPAATVIANASLKVMAELIDHSFVRRAGGGGGQYEMHELTRQIAAERLAADRQLQQETERTHALYFSRYLEERADTLYGPKTVQHLMDIDQRFGDICLAWDYLAREAQFEQLDTLLDVIYNYCRTRGKYLKGIELLDSVLERLTNFENLSDNMKLLQARFQSRQGIIYGVMGKREQALALVDKAQHLSESCLPTENRGRFSLEATVAFCLYARLYTSSSTTDAAKFEMLYTRGVELYKKADVPIGIAIMHNMRGVFSHEQGDLREAHRFYQISYEVALSLEYYQLLSITLHNLGKISQDLGDYAESMDYLEQSLYYQHALNDEEGVAYVSRNMARISLHQGNYADALALGHKALEIFESILYPRGIAFSYYSLGEALYAQGDLDQALTRLDDGMNLCNTLGYQIEGAEIATTQGGIVLEQGKIEQAKRLAEQALNLAQKSHSRSKEGPVHTLLGEIALAQNALTDAETSFETAIAISQECQAPLIALQAKVGLAALAIEKGAVDQAEQLLQEVVAHRAVTHQLQKKCEALSEQGFNTIAA